MKNFSKISLPLLCIAAAISLFSSCQKAGQSPTKITSTSVNTPAFTTSQAVVLSATASDTVYAVNICHPGDLADSVAFSSLPDTIGKYLTANYSGYTFTKAYEILSSTKVIEGYVVTIVFNGNPVGLSFNTGGIFIRVLEQREGRDLKGMGWHEGGRFGDRDNHHPDTIALSVLPTIIKAYFTTNYPNDTLKHALINRDSSYVVISSDKGIFATGFTASGTFIKRIQLYPHVVNAVTLSQAQLSASISTYLTSTYPAYVFNTAFEVKLNGTVKSYLVFIEANSTKYLVYFDATGTFVKSLVIR